MKKLASSILVPDLPAAVPEWLLADQLLAELRRAGLIPSGGRKAVSPREQWFEAFAEQLIPRLYLVRRYARGHRGGVVDVRLDMDPEWAAADVHPQIRFGAAVELARVDGSRQKLRELRGIPEVEVELPGLRLRFIRDVCH